MVDQDGNKLVNMDPVLAVHHLGLSTGGASLWTTAPFKGYLVDSSDDNILVYTTLDNTVSDEVADQAYRPQDKEDDEDNDSDTDDIMADQEAAVAQLRPLVQAKGTQDVKEVKERCKQYEWVSEDTVFKSLLPSHVIVNILDMIMSHSSPSSIIDRRDNAHRPLALADVCIKHYKLSTCCIIKLASNNSDCGLMSLFAGVLTKNTLMKHIIPGI